MCFTTTSLGLVAITFYTMFEIDKHILACFWGIVQIFQAKVKKYKNIDGWPYKDSASTGQ